MAMVIFDIDGVIADTDHRQHMIPDKWDPTPDWLPFHRACVDDPIVPQTLALVRMAANANGVLIVFVTGRPDAVRSETERWLRENVHQYFSRLYMRENGDTRPSAEVKSDMIDRYRLLDQDVLFVVEDHPRCVAMWRQRGFVCLDVGQYISGDPQ